MSYEFEVKTHYPMRIVFFIGNYKEFIDTLNDRYSLGLVEEDPGVSKAETRPLDEYGVVFVWMSKYKNTLEDRGYLVHELVHVISKVSQYIGMEMKEDTEEPLAYLLQHLYTEFHLELKNVKKR